VPQFTDKYDGIYRRWCPNVPHLYLRALAGFESNSNPKSKTGTHWGLLQVGLGPLEDFNQRKGESWDLSDMLNPQRNVRVFCDYYATVGRVFASIVKLLGPVDGANFKPNWHNSEYARLVTMAWNTGIGAVKAAAKAVKVKRALAPMLSLRGPVTSVDLFTAGRALKIRKASVLFSTKKQSWQSAVVGSYKSFSKSRADAHRAGLDTTKGGNSWGLLLIAALLLLSKN